MTADQYVTLLSASSGAAGTFILFRATYAFEPLSGGVFGGPEIDKWNARVRADNKRRAFLQKLGLVLLGLSFVVQAASAFLPGAP